MRLDSGILYLKRLSNSAEAGLMPVMTETQIGVYCYAERVVGFSDSTKRNRRTNRST